MNETLRRLHRDRSGFTLVELLIALAVAGVIGTSIYFVYRGQTRVFFIQETVAQTQSELRFAMETIKSDVKRAGYLAPISTTNDNFWCGSRPSQPITAIFAQASNGFVHNSSENINITPDSLRVLGSFSANNTLYTEGVSGNVITVSADAIYSPGFPKSQADFDRVFAPGRLLNILDAANRYQIQSITAQSYGSRTITVSTINRSTIQGCGPTGIGGATCFSKRTTFDSVQLELTRPTVSIARI